MSLSAGTKLGPYEILAPIGAGGMGEVYKAHDPRLKRDVAIKVSAAQFSERFEREAQAIAALNHSNICQLYDVGPNYLVMEYIEGTPLKGPLPLDQALKYAAQICDALEAAHKKGITHRDLKPANILVTGSGVKLLDFGLAQVRPAAKPGDDATQSIHLTQAGTILGTAAYMSPEQAEGKPVDARSDIFSFGLVLYEMLTGQSAFQGESAIAIMAAILYKEPAALDAPPALRNIVTRCLCKSPANRFQSATELRTALESVATARPEDKQPSIAVLPFANMSGDKENEYFSDGLAEEIINMLAHISGLKVIARTSAFAFRGKEQDIRKIAEELGVRTILEGSLRRAGSRIRVAAQLIDAGGGHQIWSERYDRELTDVFAVQDEIAAAIAAALRPKLAGEPAALRRHSPNIPAYEAWLKGRYYGRKVTPEGMARSKEYFEQAIDLDPDFAEAHADLGGYHLNLWTAGLRPAEELVPQVRTQARKTVELSGAVGHVLLGVLAAAFDYDWKEAELHFGLFLASGESKEEARATCANYYFSPFGRIHEAVEMLERMVESDPLNVRSRSALGNHLTTAVEYDRAVRELRKALEIDENAWFVHAALVRSYLLKGAVPEALRCAETAYRLAPWNAIVVGQLAALLVRIGDRSRGEASIRQFMDSSNPRSTSIGMLFYHLICEETDAAAGWFEKAIEERDPALIPYVRHPLIKPLRSSSRWPALAKMMNLPESVG